MANIYRGDDLEAFIFDENATYEEESCSSKKEECEKDGVEVDTDTVQIAAENEAAEEIDSEIMEAVEAEMNACGVMECVDDPEVACYRIALENEQNYNMVMNAFMQKELNVLESTGQEMVYEAADIKKFFGAIQAVIDKYWTKIQGVFKAITDKIGSVIRSNDSFVKKYEKANMVTPSAEFKFKGYVFPMGYPHFGAVADKVQQVSDKYVTLYSTEESNNKFKEEFDTIKGKMRGCMCMKDDEVISADDFQKKLNEAFFGDPDKKRKDLTLEKFSTLMSELKRGATSKQHVKESYNSAKGAVAKLKAYAKKVEKTYSKGDDKVFVASARCLTDAINAATTIMSQGLNAKINAINTKMHQDRAMAAFYVAHQPKKSSANESTTIEQDLGIVLI